jgi:hypothetical protein
MANQMIPMSKPRPFDHDRVWSRRLVPLAIAALTLAPTVAAARPFSLGVQDDRLQSAGLAEIPHRLDALRAQGVRWTRVDVLWSEVAPTQPRQPRSHRDPAYRWERYDLIFRGLARRHIHPIVTFYSTPAWEAPIWPYAPRRLSHYRSFVVAFSTRYRRLVHTYEPWNEPNIDHFFQVPGRKRIRVYAAMHRVAWRAIKRANPRNVVLGPSLAPVGSSGPFWMGVVPFVRGLAKLPPLPLDAWSAHIYPGLRPSKSVAMPSFRTIPLLLAEMDAAQRGRRLPLWVTEFGYTTNDASLYRNAGVTETQQRAYTLEAVRMMRRLPRVRAAILFNVQDNHYWPSGMYREDGSAKPLAHAFISLRKEYRRRPAPFVPWPDPTHLAQPRGPDLSQAGR